MGKEVELKVKGFAHGDKKYAGYYNHERIAVDREFILKKEEDFSPLWMQPIGWKPKSKMTENQKIAEKEIIRSGLGKPVGAVETNKNKAVSGEKMSMSQMSGISKVIKPEVVKEIDIDDETPNDAEEVI